MDTSNLKVWLPFDVLPTKDLCGNSWRLYTEGTPPAIINGKLYFDGIENVEFESNKGFAFTGQDFSVSVEFNSSDYQADIVDIWKFEYDYNYNYSITLSIAQGGLWLDVYHNDMVIWPDNIYILDGQTHHIEVDYSDSNWYLFLDGQLVGTDTYTLPPRNDMKIWIAPNHYYGVYIKGYFDNFIFCNGEALHTSNFTPPTAIDYLNLYFQLRGLYFDTLRKVGDSQVDIWRYENYGTADLLSVQGTTVDTPNALFHSAFVQPSRTKCFDIPATNEIWCRFDAYSENYYNARWRAYNESNSAAGNGVCSNKTDFIFWNNNTTRQTFYSVLYSNSIQTVLLHMVSGANDGVIEAWLDGNLLYTYTGNVNNGNDFEDFFIENDNSDTLISNVIISNARISLSDNTTFDVTVDFDTERKVAYTTLDSLDFDTKRIIIHSVEFEADTERKIVPSFTLDFDTRRELIRTVEFKADTLRKIPHKLIVAPAENGVYLDTPQTSGNKSITVNISAQQLIEQLTFVTANNVDILQQIQGQILDYQFNFRVEDFTKSGILSTCKCCSNLDELLYTQIAYTLHKETWNGGTYVKKKDEDTDTTITPSIGTTYTVTKDNAMLEKPHASASSHVMAIASKLGLTPVMLFEDFDSTIDIKQEGVTYQDLISEIFNWTSVIPHKLINVFIRYNCYTRLCYLYVIQRGYEPFVWNLTEPSTTLGRAFKADIDKDFTIHRNLVRTSFGVTRETSSIEKTTTKRVAPEYEWRPVLGNEMPEDEPDTEPVDTPEEPSEVLPSHVVTVNNGVTTSIDYTYDSDGNVIRTVTHTEGGEVDTRVIVENDYQTINGQKLLYREHTIEYEWINKDWVPVDEKDIHHNYTTVGQQHVASVDRSGSIGGSFTAPARHDDKPTPFDFEVREGSGNHYIVDDNGHPFIGNGYGIYTYVDGRKIEVVGFVKERINGKTDTETDTETGTLEEVKLYDSSFPVYGASRLSEITNDIKWLNRRIQENISLNVYNFPHIFDLQDRVIFMGNVYFVQSNTFTKNEHIVNQQSLELVRWY